MTTHYALNASPVSIALVLLAALLAASIFILDTFTPLGVAIAVLYVLVIMLPCNVLSRRATAYVSIGCFGLAITSHLLQHGGFRLDPPMARLAMSLSAITITGILVFRNQTVAARLRTAEREMREMLNAIPALFMRTTPDGIVDFMNPYWKEQGFPESALGLDWMQLVHPDDLPMMATRRAHSLATGEPYDAEFRLRRLDGEYRWLMARIIAMRNEAGDIIARYSAAIDIEDRRRAEAALHQTQAELARVTRMTTLGEFSSSIAHEVNQPLATVVTNAEVCLRLLDQDPPDLGELREATRDIVSNAQRASEIIKRVRALSRKGVSTKGRLDINDVVQDIVPLLRGEALRHRLTLRLDLTPNPPAIWGDRVELQQVLINLIVNGMEAMDQIATGVREIVVRTGPSDEGGVVVGVEDHGAGLSNEAAGQMFEAFFTTKSNGMGMGLAICRSIVEDHAGRLWAGNNDGAGAIVQFALPRFQGAQA